MKKDELENLFDRLKGEFDFEEPAMGHQERFLKKLNEQQGTKPLLKKAHWWKPLLVAATVALIFGLVITLPGNGNSIEEQLVEIAPEVSQTQFHFASLVEEQVQKLEYERTPETARLIDDTLTLLNKLDNDYQGLENDLLNGGNKELILNAMINNFQTRIDLLKEVLNRIETIKTIKSQNDENFTI